MAIWHTTPTLQDLADWDRDTLAEHLGLEWLEVGEDFLRARLPVDRRTHQPMGLLHGGASAVLAETVGSVAANFVVDPAKFRCLGLEINANHVRGAKSGWVTGTARPLHLGRNTQVWDIRIENELNQLVCVARLTMAVVPVAQLEGR